MRRRGAVPPRLEWLENRIVFAVGPTPLPFTAFQTAHAAGFLATPNEFNLYQVSLGAGDVVCATVNASASGGALQSTLRVFTASGQPIALDDQQGGDPRLIFQAAAAGSYLVGISSAGDDAYDPTVASSGQGSSTGLYSLDLRRTPAVPLTPDLAGSSFRLQTTTAAYGDSVTGTFRVDNRGGTAAGPFAVQVVLSADNLFGPQSPVLTTLPVAGLGAGQAFTPGSFTVILPDLASATAAGLPASGPVYLGLRIDPAGAVPELNPHDQSGVHRGEDWEWLTVVTPVTASGNNHSLASADVLGDLNSRVSGVLTAGQNDWYQLTVPATGGLTAVVTASGGGTLVPRLTLADASGHVLIQSDTTIVQHLLPGTYSLSVAATSGAGTYQLTTDFRQGSSPFVPAPARNRPVAVVLADLNGDGIPDIVTANFIDDTVSVLLGNGDGTFQPQQTYAVGSYPDSVAVADLNNDGKPDIVVANFSYSDSPDQTVSVLLGNGDGTFQPQKTVIVGLGPSGVAVGDVNGDRIPDLVVGNQLPSGGATVSVLLGKGDGTFGPRQAYAIDPRPSFNVSVAVVDVNGDGKPDIVAADYGANGTGSISVLLGNGDGMFQLQQTFAVSANPYSLVVADLNGDGKPDLVTNGGGYGRGTGIGVLLGNGDGTFQPELTFAGPSNSVAVADVNGDGKPDIVIPNSVLLGNGDGTFQPPQTLQGGSGAIRVAVADLNGDGKPDIVTGSGNGTVSVLLGNGDGTFQSEPNFSPRGVPLLADVNGDGKPDIVALNRGSHTVSVLLGNGDGTFQPPQTFRVSSKAVTLAVADLNGDGKPDLFVTNSNATGSVLLGNGDGTFQPPQTFSLGSGFMAPLAPSAVADVNGDGKPDIVAITSGAYTPGSGYTNYSVSVLLGKGDGTFRPIQSFPLGTGAASVWVADVNGDGKPDLIVGSDATPSDYGASVLLGNGDGTFQPPQKTVFHGANELLVKVADVNGDGKPDLIVKDEASLTMSVLLGNGDGTFGAPQTIPGVNSTTLLAVADVNGDGKPDLVFPSSGGTISVLLGNGDGTFGPPQTFAVAHAGPVALADLNGDGRPDIVAGGLTLSVLLGNGDGTFAPLTPGNGVSLRNTPYLVDLTGDGLSDSVVLDGSGNVLFRKGLPGTDSPFAPPVILNPGRPARDLTVLQTATGPVIATADASFDPSLSGPNHFVYTISLYALASNGTVHRTTAFSTTLLPTRIAAADLTGNGLGDLVVADSLNNSIQVAFQQPNGTFGPPLTLGTGEDPSDLSLADVTGTGLPDIVVSNQASGEVSVFLNDPSHSFATSYRFRSGTSLYGLDTTSATPAVRSLEQPVSLAAGDFTGTGRNDVVVVNRGADSFSVLLNDGSGGFANPQPALTTFTSDGFTINSQPGPIVAGAFHGPNQPLDLAILMKDRAEVWIYTGNGDRTFSHSFSIPVGASPTGLNVVRNPQTGLPDLLVGDPFGDVLHLQGKGDGTFQIAGNRASIAVQDLGNGQQDVLFANQQSDRITIQAPQSGGARFTPVVTLADGSHSTLAPGAVQWAKLDKQSPFFDAVVLASGGNQVLVYRGTGFDAAGNPTFAAPVSQPVGTNPVAVTIQDLNGDGIPDMLVADQGSNDVAELFGSWDANGNWVATAGPRLKSGGSGPIATAVVTPQGGGQPELVVTNGQSGTLAVLPGVGKGFFNDQNPQILNIPGNPVLTQGPTSFGTSGAGLVVAATGQLIGFDVNNFAASVATLFTPPAGQGVQAAQALADGHVVAALDGGAVVDLAPAAGGLAEDLAFAPLSGIPSDPSALAVLQGESGLQVLVTEAGSNGLFVFGIPGLAQAPALPPAEAPAGPTVEVTPPAEGSLTLVVTLTSGIVPPGSAPVPEVPAAAAAVAAAAPAPASGGMTAVAPAATAQGDPAGEDVEGAEGLEAGSEGGVRRPAADGLDVDGKLREIDLYQPTPPPERPGPTSRRPAGQSDEALLAMPPAAQTVTGPGAPASLEDWWAGAAEVVPQVAANLATAQPPAPEVTDTIFAQPPPEWDVVRRRLLAVAGLALGLWLDCRPEPKRRAHHEMKRKARRAV
jgi:hypothetical protein